MAVVFLEGGLSPIPMRMASTKPYRDPYRGVCQSAQSKARTYKKQLQFVPEPQLFSVA
jgi:hypothetical protein